MSEPTQEQRPWRPVLLNLLGIEVVILVCALCMWIGTVIAGQTTWNIGPGGPGITVSCIEGTHTITTSTTSITCVADGKPPRNHDGRWVCDNGYEPDGLDVTWPNGVFTPQPALCKAKEKP